MTQFRHNHIVLVALVPQHRTRIVVESQPLNLALNVQLRARETPGCARCSHHAVFEAADQVLVLLPMFEKVVLRLK